MSDHVYWYKCDVRHDGDDENGIYAAVILRPNQQEADQTFQEMLKTHNFERSSDLQEAVDPDCDDDARLRAMVRMAKEHPTRSFAQYVVCA